MKVILRSEARPTERRTPLTPGNAKALMAAGFTLLVESSTQRIFADAEYAAAGCGIVPEGSWKKAEAGTTILGLKELPPAPDTLQNPFVHFAHLFKQQAGWQAELARFSKGGGRLYDLEYLSVGGRRVAAFGYWAGWMGAALAAWRQKAQVLGEAGPERGVQSFESRSEVADILQGLASRTPQKTAVVIGAKGRSGQGAAEALKLAGYSVTEWDIEETRNLDRSALLDHDLLVNCVLMTGPGLLLLRSEDLGQGKLRMISDVSCDPFSSFNPLPIYSKPSTWEAPFEALAEGVEITSIDNLPSLLPREASEDFSDQLLPTLLAYPDGEAWQAARASFEDALKRADG
ncbi:MAG: saccharopine dehydrogenase [Rhodobacteraceae bacterium]|nr:saccharopine dehydrogenase [Paracoccaceae bacterium]